MKTTITTITSLLFCFVALAACGKKEQSPEAALAENDSTAFTFMVPNNLSLIKGQPESPIYRLPDASSAKLLYAEQGEGTYTIFDDEKLDSQLEHFPCNVEENGVWVNMGEEGDFFKVPITNGEEWVCGVGYTPKNKVVEVKREPLTLEDFAMQEPGDFCDPFTPVTSGKYKGLVFSMEGGEGGPSYRFGCIKDDILVLSDGIYMEYDENAKGLSVTDGIVTYGSNYAGKDSGYGCPGPDIKKMSEADLQTLVECILKNNSTEENTYTMSTICVKVGGQLEYIGLPAETMKQIATPTKIAVGE